jgi:hypothetical protein
MPPTPRSETTRGGRTRTTAAPVEASPAVGESPPVEETPPVEQLPSSATVEARGAAGDAVGAGAGLARSVGHVITLPITVARAVVDDVASTARRPDAVVYWGGLAGLAALGVLEWPVAAAVGVGVAVAGGRQRARTEEPVG